MFNTVVIGVDGRAGGRDAIALGRRLARPGARLVFVGVFAPAPVGRAGAVWNAVQSTHAHQQLQRECRLGDVLAETITCCERSPGRALHAIARRRGADLIALGARQQGWLGRRLPGQATASTLGAAPCAVAIAPRGFATTPPAWGDIDDFLALEQLAADGELDLAETGASLAADPVRPLLARPGELALAVL